MQVREMSVWEM